jgi:hypothetical protein
MNAYNSAQPHSISRIAFAALALTLIAAPIIGCDSYPQPDHNLRADLAAIRTSHGDPDAIGSLDETAPPSNLNDYRRPTYRTVATH